MDLFQDFSFSKSVHHHNVIDDIAPAQDISPRSSRSSSPFSTSSSSSSTSPNQSFMNLSNATEPLPLLDLDEYSFPSYPTTPLSSRLPSMDKRRRSAQVYFDTVRQRRQSAIRLQCDPKNAAGIRNYVERFLNSQCYSNDRSPSIADQPYMPPPTSAPMQDFSLERMDSSSEDEEAEAFKSLSLSDRPNSNERLTSGASAFGRRKSYAVQKSTKSKTRISRRS